MTIFAVRCVATRCPSPHYSILAAAAFVMLTMAAIVAVIAVEVAEVVVAVAVVADDAFAELVELAVAADVVVVVAVGLVVAVVVARAVKWPFPFHSLQSFVELSWTCVARPVAVVVAAVVPSVDWLVECGSLVQDVHHVM